LEQVDVCGYCNGTRGSTRECTYCDGLVYPASAAWAAPVIDDCEVCAGGNQDKGYEIIQFDQFVLAV